MAKISRNFVDLDLNFTANPVTGDVPVKYDEDAIKQSIKNLVMTINYERPFHPEIGCQVNNLLFENMTPMTQVMLEESIRNVIDNFEPRVTLLDVDVYLRNDEYSVDISITFRIINTTSPITVDFILTRTR